MIGSVDEPEGTRLRPNGSVLNGTPPHQRSRATLTNQPGHDLTPEINVSGRSSAHRPVAREPVSQLDQSAPIRPLAPLSVMLFLQKGRSGSADTGHFSK